jgi:hypothetical protein
MECVDVVFYKIDFLFHLIVTLLDFIQMAFKCVYGQVSNFQILLKLQQCLLADFLTDHLVKLPDNFFHLSVLY